MPKKTLIIISTFLFIAAIGVAYAVRSQNVKQPIPMAKPPHPIDKPLSVKISTVSASYKYGDTVEFAAAIRNTSETPKTFTFNSTCTQGTLFVDLQPTQTGLVCGDAIMDVKVQAQETITHTYSFKLVKEFSSEVQAPAGSTSIEIDGELLLEPGVHTAYLEWQGTKSEPVEFHVGR